MTDFVHIGHIGFTLYRFNSILYLLTDFNMVDYMSSSGREYSAISGTNSQMFTEVTQDTASPYTHTGSNGTELVLETQNDEVSTEESQYETTVNDPDLTRSGRSP